MHKPLLTACDSLCATHRDRYVDRSSVVLVFVSEGYFTRLPALDPNPGSDLLC